MARAERGEVWMVDLGLAAKVRPEVVVSVPFLDNERALYSIIPHTTAVWGTRFEVQVAVRGLEEGAFDAQGVRPIPGRVFMRRLGGLSPAQMVEIEAALRRWFGMRT